MMGAGGRSEYSAAKSTLYLKDVKLIFLQMLCERVHTLQRKTAPRAVIFQCVHVYVCTSSRQACDGRPLVLFWFFVSWGLIIAALCSGCWGKRTAALCMRIIRRSGAFWPANPFNQLMDLCVCVGFDKIWKEAYIKRCVSLGECVFSCVCCPAAHL